jgi:hypothetical protein
VKIFSATIMYSNFMDTPYALNMATTTANKPCWCQPVALVLIGGAIAAVCIGFFVFYTIKLVGMRGLSNAKVSVRRDAQSGSFIVKVEKKNPKDGVVTVEEKPATADAVKSYALKEGDKDVPFFMGRMPDGSEKFVRKRNRNAMIVGEVFLGIGAIIGIWIFAYGLSSV